VAGALLVAAPLAAGAATAAPTALPAAASDAPGSRFTLAVLPDTQFYSRYSADQFLPRYGTDPFREQTRFLAEHADELNIPFVAHLGDVVDRVGQTAEWQAADAAMRTLEEGGLPYSILPGNHDVRNSDDRLDDTDYDLAAEPFLQWFGPARAAGQATYGANDPTGLSQYHVFEAEGQEFMVLALAWRVSDQTIQWAKDAMAAHPDVPVILTTHSLLNIGPDQTSPRDTEYGEELWDKLIRGSDQIFLTFNGHFHGATQQTRTNDFGHSVTNVLIDYQMAYEGGNGYLGLVEFDLSHDTVSLQTASPWVTAKPQETLTSYDQPFLEGPHQQFTLDLDFSERFAGFDPDFGPGAGAWPSLRQTARDVLLDGFVGPDPVTTELPGNALDFPEAEGTVAHWRMNGLPAGVLPEGGTIPDVAAGNDLTRATIAASGSAAAQAGDVTIVHDDVHGYSSDAAAVCFANSSAARFSYLTTAADAPVNAETFPAGYTIETFLQLDPTWDAGVNGWSKAVVRSGDRSQLPGMPWSQWDYTASPVALGISNLREFQYTEVPAATTKADRTAWSGEIMVDSWSHVAIVNDPATSTTTMYVDGAPVLRNATDTLGHSIQADMPWLLGSDWVDGAARNGWNGCIGETRVIDRPTGPAEWLTQRADLSGLTVQDAPSGELPAGTQVTALQGTGFPGAVVRVTDDVAGAAAAAGDAEVRTAASAVAAAPASLAGETVVGADGRWTLAYAGALPAGAYDGTVVQALGSRTSAPADVAFAIAAAPVVPADPGPADPVDPPAGGGTGAGTGGAGTGTGTGSGSGSTTAGSRGSLATTGAQVSAVAAAALAALALGAGGVALRRRARRAAQAD
jgi:3',5'-cyclic AMP phosphodiesterase CpdA